VVRRSAFTIVELVVTAAIVSALVAIAMPRYLRLEQKARSAEAKVHLGAIRTAERVYYSTFARYAAASPTPASIPGASPAAFIGGGSSEFSTLGFVPESSVSFQYAVEVDPLYPDVYTADARADLDGDGRPQIWGLRHLARDGGDGRGGPDPHIAGRLGCTRVVSETDPDVVDVPGPCAPSTDATIEDDLPWDFQTVDAPDATATPYGQTIF